MSGVISYEDIISDIPKLCDFAKMATLVIPRVRRGIHWIPAFAGMTETAQIDQDIIKNFLVTFMKRYVTISQTEYFLSELLLLCVLHAGVFFWGEIDQSPEPLPKTIWGYTEDLVVFGFVREVERGHTENAKKYRDLLLDIRDTTKPRDVESDHQRYDSEEVERTEQCRWEAIQRHFPDYVPTESEDGDIEQPSYLFLANILGFTGKRENGLCDPGDSDGTYDLEVEKEMGEIIYPIAIQTILDQTSFDRENEQMRKVFLLCMNRSRLGIVSDVASIVLNYYGMDHASIVNRLRRIVNVPEIRYQIDVETAWLNQYHGGGRISRVGTRHQKRLEFRAEKASDPGFFASICGSLNGKWIAGAEETARRDVEHEQRRLLKGIVSEFESSPCAKLLQFLQTEACERRGLEAEYAEEHREFISLAQRGREEVEKALRKKAAGGAHTIDDLTECVDQDIDYFKAAHRNALARKYLRFKIDPIFQEPIPLLRAFYEYCLADHEKNSKLWEERAREELLREHFEEFFKTTHPELC